MSAEHAAPVPATRFWFRYGLRLTRGGIGGGILSAKAVCSGVRSIISNQAVSVFKPQRATVQPEAGGRPREDRGGCDLGLGPALAVSALTVAAFHLAYWKGGLSFMMAFFCAGLFALSHLGSTRQALGFGVGIGLCCYAPHLGFLWSIFCQAAVVLWLILAVWIGLFLVMVRTCRVRLGNVWAAVLAPFLWTGLEYFRSELYWLKFSWLSVGYAFADCPQVYVVAGLGIYGIGFELMGCASLATLLPWRARWAVAGLVVGALGVLTNLEPAQPAKPGAGPSAVRVAGIQLEFPAELEAVQALDALRAARPEAELLVLSEYTLDGSVTRHFTNWCARHARHVVVGGKDYLDADRFFNTAFVINPRGGIAFQQAKSVPIQFFKDGLPARQQSVWPSPWGKLGFAICYDLSYARVIDRLVEEGAQALIVPTMDVAEWGEYEHRLHARVAPMRAAEYGLPVFRLASSGISQLVDARGRTLASAPYPGEKAVLAGDLPLVKSAVLPIDRWLGPESAALAGLIGLAMLVPGVGFVRWPRLEGGRV